MQGRAANHRSTSLIQRFQRLVQTRLWGMDIHPTAWIAASALIDRTWPRGIHIGADCVIAEEAVVLTHDMTRGIYMDTRIGDGTTVGARAIIMPGITVGRNCTILPGTLVNRDLPDGVTVVGNPARVVEPQAERESVSAN